MALLQCEMCCGELEISADKSTSVCKYCGSTFTIPKQVERKGNLFNRANYLRQNCNFDKAIGIYESILADDCEDVDALWGLVLCRYGIEFVEDPKTKTRIPTCHRASRTSILIDADFKTALQFADEDKRAVYLANATRIDQIQKAIISLSDTQEKYDVFICYKESDENGDRTIDSVFAQEVYNELTKMKIKTFFSRKTLEGKVGSSYEPIIYSALNSARVMIVIGTKPEYFEATWVKNEWSRYLSFMKDSDDKHLIPAYKNMSAYQLPEEFVSIQALDMDRIGFMLDLCDGVKKLLRKDENDTTESAGPISKESLYSRAMVFLGNREFYKAVDYFEKVLDIDPRYARAYWGSLLASYQCVTNNELINCMTDDWTEDARFNNAIQFANDEEKKIYEDTFARRIANFKKMASNSLEKKEFERCIFWCDKFIAQDPKDGSIWWLKLLAANEACNSNDLYQNCVNKATSILGFEEYKNAVEYSIPEEVSMYERVAKKIKNKLEENKRNAAFEECKEYMERSIAMFRKNMQDITASQQKNYSIEHDSFKAIKNNNGSFYKNNFFAFIFNIIIWALPIYALAFLFTAEVDDPVTTLAVFGVLFGITRFITTIVNLTKLGSGSKERNRLIRKCKKAEDKIEEEKLAYQLAHLRETEGEKLYKELISAEDLTVEDIEKRRCDFDKIYDKKLY